MTELASLSYLLSAGEGWDVTSSAEVKTVPVTCWDGVGSWRQVMLARSCETLVKTLLLFLILLLCVFFLFSLSGMGLLAWSKPVSMTIRQYPLISDLLRVSFLCRPVWQQVTSDTTTSFVQPFRFTETRCLAPLGWLVL